MGGKYRSLKYIIPNFGTDIDIFYDIFSGSGTVGLNTRANKVISNDINTPAISLQKFIGDNEPKIVYEGVRQLADEFDLASTENTGYNRLRSLYNEDKDPLKLLALSQHSFNFLIRFNGNGEFNASHGKGISKLSRDFLEKLEDFHTHVKDKQVEFSCTDFRKSINLNNLSYKDFVYCDPPYLLSEAVYNEKRALGRWTKQDSIELLNLLNEINEIGVKFALSEMTYSKGKTNDMLIKWASEGKYSIIERNVKYLGVPSTHSSNKQSVEVLITNY